MRRDIEIIEEAKFYKNHRVNSEYSHIRVTLDMPIKAWRELKKTIQYRKGEHENKKG